MSLSGSLLGDEEDPKNESDPSLETNRHPSKSARAVEVTVPQHQHAILAPSEGIREGPRVSPDGNISVFPQIPITNFNGFAASPILNGFPNLSEVPDGLQAGLASTAGLASDMPAIRDFGILQILSKLDCSSNECFAPVMQDFTESNCATGCEITTPRTVTMPLSVIIDTEDNAELDVDVSYFEHLLSYSQPPRPRAGISAYELTDRDDGPENPAQHDAKVTVPKKPIFRRLADGSGFSFDGMSASRKRADTISSSIFQGAIEIEDDVSPTSNAPPQGLLDSSVEETRSPESALVSKESDSNATTTVTLHPRVGVEKDGSLEAGATREVLTSPACGEVNLDGKSPINSISPYEAPIPGIPRDITGEFPSPKPHNSKRPKTRDEKREEIKHGIQTFYRKARIVLLQKGVLDIIVGRKISRATRDNLVAISDGLPAIIIDVATTELDTPQSVPC